MVVNEVDVKMLKLMGQMGSSELVEQISSNLNNNLGAAK